MRIDLSIVVHIAVCCLLLAACGAADDADTTARVLPPSDAPEDAQQQLVWLLDAVEGEAVSADDYANRVAPSFRDELPFDIFSSEVLDRYRAGAPYDVASLRAGGVSDLAAIVTARDGTRIRVLLSVDRADRIEALVLEPAGLSARRRRPCAHLVRRSRRVQLQSPVIGSSTRKVEPTPTWLSSVMVPPCRSVA